MNLKEFRKFLSEYKVAPLALAFVIGITLTSFIQSLVNYLFMPIVTFFIPGGAWRNVAFALGPIILPWGALLSAILSFLLIMLVVFIFAKSMLKEEKAAKK